MDNQNKKLVLTIASIFAVGAVGYMVYSGYNKPEFSVEVKDTNKQVTQTKTTTTQNKYKDGTYTKLGNYVSPGGPEQIEVTVTVKDGVVVDSNVIAKATLAGSVKMQEVFINNYKSLVLGKNIQDIKLDKVSGASLTPKGFNDAIKQVMEEAKI